MVQEGNIKYHVDIADSLITQGEYRAALTMLLIAVAASSSKMFPEGTESIDNPAVKPGKFNKMGDKEKFVRFLGPRIRIMLGFASTQDDGRHSGLPHLLSSAPDPEVFIYERCRCPQIHEAGLPETVKFMPHLTESIEGISIELDGRDGITFSSGFLTLLRRAVVESPVNGKEFGIHHFRASFDGYSDTNDFAMNNHEALGITPGRINIICSIAQGIKGAHTNISNEELELVLIKTIKQHKEDATFTLNSMGEPILTQSGELSKTGKACISLIMKNVDFIDIAS